MDPMITNIISLVLMIFTIVMLAFVLISALFGLRRSWKFSLIKLGRTVLAIALAFITAKILTSAIPLDEILSSLMGMILGDQLTDLEATSPTLFALISNMPIAIVAPFMLVSLYFLFNWLLMIPAIFVKKGVLKKEKQAKKAGKKAKKELKLLRKQHKKEEKLAKKNGGAVAVAEPAPELTAEPVLEPVLEPELAPALDENGEPVLDENGEPVMKPVLDENGEPVMREVAVTPAELEAPHEETFAEKVADLKKTIKDGKIKWGSRGISAGIKAVNAVLFIALLFMPIACLLTTVGDGVITIKDAMIESGASFGGTEEDPDAAIDGETLTEICDGVVTPILTNPVIVVSSNSVYHAMYRSLTQVDVGGVECYLDNELADIFELVGGATYLLTDIEDYGEPQKNAINTVVGYVADSEFRSTVAAEFFSAVASAWQNGEAFFGVENPTTEDLAMIVDPLLEILANSTAESVEKDLHTFSNILGVFIDHKMFSVVMDTMESEDPMASVSKIASSEFLADVLVQIYTNEDYKTMTQPVVKFTFNTLLSAIGAEPMKGASSDAPDMTEEEIREEARVICSIILSAVDFIDSMPEDTSELGGLDIITEINVAALGDFYDNSQHSLILKDGFHDVFVALLSSDMLDDMRPVCDILVDHINNDPNLNMKNLLVATQELASIFIQYQGGEISTDIVSLTKTLQSLVSKVDDSTSKIIQEMIDSDAFGMDFLGGDNGSQVSTLLTTVVATLGNLSEEELEKEAKAIDYMMKIVNVGTSSGAGTSLESIFEAEEDNAEEMVETMLTSKLATEALNAIAYEEDDQGNKVLTEDALAMSESVSEEDKESVISSAESYYKENATTMSEEEKDDLKNNINAIASIFGKDLTSNFAEWDASIVG